MDSINEGIYQPPPPNQNSVKNHKKELVSLGFIRLNLNLEMSPTILSSIAVDFSLTDTSVKGSFYLMVIKENKENEDKIK